jgi:hypothetical protein
MTAPHAQLRLRRTGGIAGVATEASLDTAELDQREAQRLLAALDAVEGAAGQPAGPPSGPPDAFRYELEVRRGGQTHTLSFTDANRPQELTPVIDALAARARPAPRRR